MNLNDDPQLSTNANADAGATIDTAPAMPAQDISQEVLLEKYAKGDETCVDDIYRRVATALAQPERAEEREMVAQQFLHAMRAGLVPAGRIASAAGTTIDATLMNCFVQPVADAIGRADDGTAGIYTALSEAAETMRRGGGVGYDFSLIRPSGAWVKGTHSRASGPVSYMRVFDRSCETVESAGARRGAQMGVMRCDHPDIQEFIHAKDSGDLKNFNISIAVTDAFMTAVQQDAEVPLWHAARPGPDTPQTMRRDDGTWIYKTVRARDLWDQVMRATYSHGEPGILFLTRANVENNLYYCETLNATNPCAEQWLPNYGCCDLGSLNLTRFVRRPFTVAATIDMDALQAVTRTAVRMLDNALDVTFWPLSEQRQEAMNKRRIGVGFLGLGDALVMLGVRYDTPQAREIAADISKAMRDAAYDESINLAIDKGAFPLFDADKFLAGAFASRLPKELRQRIRQHGLRNSHLLSIAPTGTISLAFADNASNGIEPAFSWSYQRKKRMPDGTLKTYDVDDHAWRLYRHLGGDVSALPPTFVSALQMSATDHTLMLAAVQPYVDSSISKTVNVPAEYPFEDFRDLYMLAWQHGLKGLATYRPNDVRGSVLSTGAPAAATSGLTATTAAAPDAPAPAEPPATPMHDDPLLKRFDRRPAGELEGVTNKISYMTGEGERTVYVTVNFAQVNGILNGQHVSIRRPIEFFVPAAQLGEAQQWIASNMRLLSMVARSGMSVAKALDSMRQTVWDRGPVRYGWITHADGTKRVPRVHDSEVAALAYAMQDMLYRRGFLDADFNQVPSTTLAKAFEALADPLMPTQSATSGLNPMRMGGAKCNACGAHAVHKIDGCKRCENCGEQGACG